MIRNYYSNKRNSYCRSSQTTKHQRGFSLPELLIVVACVGILATISSPLIGQSRRKARLTAGMADTRELITTEHQYHLQNKRYARMDELNAFRNGYLGTIVGSSLKRGQAVFQMVPSAPTDDQLTARFNILTTLVNTDGTIVQLLGTDSGEIKQLTR